MTLKEVWKFEKKYHKRHAHVSFLFNKIDIIVNLRGNIVHLRCDYKR